MAKSQNGWPALEQASPLLRTWVIPARNGTARLRLRNGSAGFILAVYALWFAETIEPLADRILDDWGWAWRPVRGQTTGLSNHASGTAMDLNATRHPLGHVGTFSPLLTTRIQARLLTFRGALRSGVFYLGRKDPMHVEVNAPLAQVEAVAQRLLNTPRGRRVLEANPGQREVILL